MGSETKGPLVFMFLGFALMGKTGAYGKNQTKGKNKGSKAVPYGDTHYVCRDSTGKAHRNKGIGSCIHKLFTFWFMGFFPTEGEPIKRVKRYAFHSWFL
jgi:hypothetical protein